jgi:hypothetical protein
MNDLAKLAADSQWLYFTREVFRAAWPAICLAGGVLLAYWLLRNRNNK